MLIEHRGVAPRVPDSAYVAPTAVLCGDVEIGDECRIMFGAVLVAEGAPVRIGPAYGDHGERGPSSWPELPVSIGNDAMIGPAANVSGARSTSTRSSPPARRSSRPRISASARSSAPMGSCTSTRSCRPSASCPKGGRRSGGRPHGSAGTGRADVLLALRNELYEGRFRRKPSGGRDEELSRPVRRSPRRPSGRGFAELTALFLGG